MNKEYLVNDCFRINNSWANGWFVDFETDTVDGSDFDIKPGDVLDGGHVVIKADLYRPCPIRRGIGLPQSAAMILDREIGKCEIIRKNVT